MTDTSKKIIAVVGATGSQGSGLVRAILADPSSGFTARALTRDVQSPKAQELARLGAEVVHADLDDPASVTAAFRGAYGAFCVTFYWAHMSPEREQANARTMAEAAKAASLQHVIWSTLEDTRRWVPVSDNRMPTLMGNYKVPHFDAKGDSDHFFTDLGLPVTFLLTSFYWDNLYMFGMGPKKGPDGKYAFTIPMGDKKLPGIAAEDIGKAALGIFKRPRDYIGKTVAIAGEHLSGKEMAAELTKSLGVPVHYNAVDHDTFRRFGFPGADDLGNMFQFKHDFESAFRAPRDVAIARALDPDLQTFAQFLSRNKEKISLD